MQGLTTPALQERLADLVTAAASRAAHAVTLFLASTAGPNSDRRRSSGTYDVIRSLERYPQALHVLSGEAITQAPHLDTVDVLAASIPPTLSTLVLLEAQRAPRDTRLDYPPTPDAPPVIASRRYDARWPEALRAAYRSCLAAYLAWSTSCDADWIHSKETTTPTAASMALFLAWRELEQQWAPRFAALEAGAEGEADSGSQGGDA